MDSIDGVGRENRARALFLEKVACCYAVKCPALAAHLGTQLALQLRRAGMESKVLCVHCSMPIIAGNSSTTRTLTSARLRHKRRRAHVKSLKEVASLVHDGAGGSGNTSRRNRPSNTHVVVHCGGCGLNTVIGSHPRTPRNPPPSASNPQASSAPSSRTPQSHTPACSPLQRRRTGDGKCRPQPSSSLLSSCTISHSASRSTGTPSSGGWARRARKKRLGLKAALGRSQSFEQQRAHEWTSPNFSHFLTSSSPPP